MEKEKTISRGVIAGNFDVIHPGYIKMFKESNIINYCPIKMSTKLRVCIF